MRIIVIIAKKIIPHDIRVFLRKVNWRLRYFILIFGKSYKEKVFCPIANKEFKTFIKIGNELRTPSNGAKNRQRLVWLYLTKELNILQDSLRVLHIAPELSYFEILKKQKNINYFPGDKMVAGYSNQKGINNIDLTELNYEDNFFDIIVCNHVLEHIPDDIKAISEMYRVLKKGGKAIVTVPIDENLEKTYENPNITSPTDREKHFGQWDHVRMYAVDIKQRFADNGFHTELIKYSNIFSSEEFNKMGLCSDSIIVNEKTIF